MPIDDIFGSQKAYDDEVIGDEYKPRGESRLREYMRLALDIALHPIQFLEAYALLCSQSQERKQRLMDGEERYNYQVRRE